MKRFYFFLVMMLFTCPLVKADYFWIGNGGDWNDLSHWSLTSGAVDPPAVLPGFFDNVFFDLNSFTLPGQVVYILDAGTDVGVAFRTMDWRGVTNNPTFQIRRVTSSWIYNSCNGSIYFDDNMVLDFLGVEIYMDAMTDYDLDTRGHNLGVDSWIAFNGGFNVENQPGSVVTAHILSDINNGRIFINKGTVNFHGHSFLGPNETYPAIWANGTTFNSTVDISNSNVDIGSLTISANSTWIDNNAVLTLRSQLSASGQDFNHVKAASLGLINGSNNNTFQTLEILPGATVKLISGTTQTVNNLVAQGTQAMPITLESTIAGTLATINKTSGTVNTKFVHLKDITATGGATFNAIDSWDEGNNTGWNFLFTSSPVDSLALVALYQNTAGTGWARKTNWLTGKANTWQGVTFTRNNVTALSLANNNLIGTVPVQINDMESLEVLDLSSNSITSLPALASLLALTTVNVSDNNLDFSSLEANAGILGITNYQVQADLGVASSDSVSAGSSATVMINTGGVNNAYQWKRKGVNIINATSNEYTIASLNRNTMGEFVCEVTNTAIPGLILMSAPQVVLAVADLSGKLLVSQQTPASSGQVSLFRITTTGGYDTIQVKPVNTVGEYTFTKVVLDDYQILGFADTLVHVNAIPTYYEKTIYWEEADTLFVQGDLVDLDIVSEFKPTDVEIGNGFINGYFEGEEESETGRLMGRPRVPKAGASVRKVEGSGRENDELSLFAYVFSNENGEFTFPRLPKGEYLINLQYPGYPMDQNSFLTITVGDGLESQVWVYARIENNKINVRKLVITGVLEEESSIQVYPNPSIEYLNVSFKNQSSIRKVQLLDASGKEVKVQTASDFESKIDVRSFQSGIYFLRVLDQNHVSKVIRIVIE